MQVSPRLDVLISLNRHSAFKRYLEHPHEVACHVLADNTHQGSPGRLGTPLYRASMRQCFCHRVSVVQAGLTRQVASESTLRDSTQDPASHTSARQTGDACELTAPTAHERTAGALAAKAHHVRLIDVGRSRDRVVRHAWIGKKARRRLDRP
jgi:hypothetical protein